VADKPPWDPQRAAFWLIALVIGIQCVVVLAGVSACLWYFDVVLKDPAIKCDPDGRLAQLLTAALTAALALWGIRKG
jgi:hypothetical protein